MTSEQNNFVVATITLKALANPSDVISLSVSNRDIFNTGANSIFPILKEVSDVGYIMDTYKPNTTSITITLDNSPNSLGFQRRASDLLQRYTMIDQAITLNFYALDLTAEGTVEGDAVEPATTIFTGKVREVNAQVSDLGGRLLIQCNALNLPTRRFGFEIDRAITTIPSESVGKTVPLVLGSSVEVAPIRLGSDGDPDVTYIWGTTLWSTFVNDGIQDYYARSRDDKMYKVTNAVSITTDLLNHTGATSSTLVAVEANEYAARINYTDLTDNYIVTKVYMTFVGSLGNVGIVAGTTHFAIYDRKPARNRPRAQPIAQGSFDNTTYTANWEATAEFTADAMLDEPVFLSGTKGYFISLSFRDLGAMVARVPMFTSTTSLGMKWRTTQHAWGLLPTFTDRAPKFKFRGLNLASANTTPSNSAYYDGLGYSTFTVLSPAASSGQEKPDSSKIEWILEVNGIKDDGGGTLTGSAGKVLVQPDEIFKLLDYKWDGFGTTTWSDENKIDVTTFSATYAAAYGASAAYKRDIGGASRGLGLYGDLLESVCRNSASRFGTGINGKLALWAWGTRVNPAFYIPPDYLNAISFKVRGADTVVNRARIQYNRDYLVLAVRYLSQNRTVINYRSEYNSQTVEMITHGRDATTFGKITKDSESLFGIRYLADDKYEMVQDSTTAVNLATYLLARHQFPEIIATFDLPLEPYLTMKLLDIINFKSAEFPAHYGTAAEQKPATLDGVVIYPGDGEPPVRAETYRGQVEGMTIQNVESSAPILRVDVRIVSPFGADPT